MMFKERIFKINNSLKRKLLQVVAFGFCNSHIGNLLTGSIYTGKWKNFCLPGLNCYSCPAATFACPIGALQAVEGSKHFSFSFYVVGLLLAFGVLLGRFICGWLCPFGFIQELIHKIPLPKIKLKKIFTYCKYVILVVFVIIGPLVVMKNKGAGVPTFCKYICPSGTLLGAIPLLATNENLRGIVGIIFSWKMLVLVLVLIMCIFIYRFFCKCMCPLGAIYGLMNKVSIYRIHIDEDKCIHCNKCARVCKMDVNPSINPNSCECIRCKECIEACPMNAISMGLKR